MSEPTTRRSPPATTESDGVPPEELSWAALLGVAPALLRATLLAGQRLLDWTGASVASVTRTIGTGSPSALLDGAVEPLRRLLGLPQIEADLRRLLTDGHVATGTAPSSSPAGADDEDPPPLPPQPPIPAPPPVALTDDAEPASSSSEPDGPEAPDETEVPEIPEAPEMPEPPGLRQRGEWLLARSATLEPDGDHPAFGVVLEQVAPDEMRVLRLLALDGDQPAVDVEAARRTGGKGQPVATRLSLLAENAGCKHPDRLPLYLDNLERLGLLRLADHPLADGGYEIIEAQSVTDAARERASRVGGRARMVRRRVGLTHFGRSFCEVCLPDAAR